MKIYTFDIRIEEDWESEEGITRTAIVSLAGVDLFSKQVYHWSSAPGAEDEAKEEVLHEFATALKKKLAE